MRRCLLTVLISLIGWLVLVEAQVCDGNLGENIFTAGDFGSGPSNVLMTNPNIAPGYLYEINPPPVDGFYTLTNNTGNWGNIYESWLQIGDNSNDPNGYMMVVNASFEPGLFYEQLVDGLCENTLYEFSADVINLIRAPVNDHIKPNVSFLLDNVEQYSTGEIAQNETWITHGFTFSTGPGQTSLTLSLQNNAPGGIGNDLALDNITFRPCGPLAQILPTDIEQICEEGNPTVLTATITGTQYDNPTLQWQNSVDGGLTWQNIPGANAMDYTHNILSSGLYYYRYLLANGPANLENSKCRVVSNIKVVEVVPKFWMITDTLCDGLTYPANQQVFTETGIYVDSLISSIGCDSIVTYDLTFMDDLGIEANIAADDPICAGEASGSIEVVNIVNAYLPYEIFINGEALGLATGLANLQSNIYQLQILDQYGCSFDTMVMLTDPPEFLVDAGPDQEVQLGESVAINPSFNFPIADFTWSPLVEDCPQGNCLDFSFIPGSSGQYMITAFSDIGCVAVDSVFINVEEVRLVYFPNVFSPNSDGFNDYFIPYVGVPNVSAINSLKIFDRWGALVYESMITDLNNESVGWDGTYRGQVVANGIYVYLAEVLFLDGQIIQYSGDVSVMR